MADIKHDLEKVRIPLGSHRLCGTIPVRSANPVSIVPEKTAPADLTTLQIPGIVSVHELHVWRLNQQKSLASAHVVIDDASLERFHGQAKTINECLHAYGVHSATIQPELCRRRISQQPIPHEGNDEPIPASLRHELWECL